MPTFDSGRWLTKPSRQCSPILRYHTIESRQPIMAVRFVLDYVQDRIKPSRPFAGSGEASTVQQAISVPLLEK